MGLADILIIAVVGIIFGFAVYKTVKNKGGCNCSGCNGACEKCNKK